MTYFDQAYQLLNKEQKLAVDTIEGPVMVIAGPGTGKTQTLAMRIANILKTTDTDPSSILALTFTDAGTRAMKNRLRSLIGKASYYVPITTFHGFCADVIRDNPELFPISLAREPISSLNKSKIISNILATLPLNKLRPLGSPGFYISSLIKSISDLKREGYSPKSFAKLVSDEEKLFNSTSNDLTKSLYIKTKKNIEKNLELVDIYQNYEDALHKNGDYDFDDMISYVAAAFAKSEDLLLTYQEKYQYILVDEYQDTNATQNTVVDLLASYWGDHANIFVVGDPNQCIMRFQGASLENILSFQDKYKQAKIIELKDNYRSHQNILDAAHCLIKTSTHLRATNKGTSNLLHQQFVSGSNELEFLGESISSLIKQGVSPNQIAVIYRKNQDAENIINTLEALAINYHVQSGSDITSNKAVKQLIKLITLLVQVRTSVDDLNLFTVLHYPYFAVDSLDVLKVTRYASVHELKLWEVVVDDQLLIDAGIVNLPPIQAFRTKLLSWQTLDATSTTTELVEKIFQESGLLDYCLTQKNSHIILNKINAFFSEIKKMNADNHEMSAQTLISDLTLMQEQGIKITDSQIVDTDSSVTLTTAHSAKGLEWDYVYIYRAVDGTWGNNRNTNLISLPAGIIKHQDLSIIDKNDDERRLFYVALTRAKKSCLITSAEAYVSGGNKKECIPSMFIDEIRDTLLPTKKIETPSSKSLNSFTLQKQEIQKDEQSFLESLLVDFRLSPTVLNTYLECPYKFKLNNLLKVPRAKAPYLSLGTAVHAALENMYKDLNSSGNVPSLDKILSYFDHALQKEVMRKNDFQKYQKKGHEILSAYYNFYKNDFNKALYMEKFFGYGNNKIFLDDIELAGKVDRIDLVDPNDNTIRLIDYKTGRPKTKGQIIGTTKDSSGAYYRQLVFYKLLTDLDKRFSPEMVEAQLDFVEPDEKGDFHRYTFTIKKEEVEELKNVIREMVKDLRSLKFPRTTDYKICESCDFKDHCWPSGIPKD